MVKILAIGDFHGKFPVKLKKIANSKGIDLVLSTGDYGGISDFRPYLKKNFKLRQKGKEITIEELAGKKKYQELLKKDYNKGKISINELNKFKIKVLSVFGNCDWYKSFFNPRRGQRDYAKVIKKLKYLKNINRGSASFKKLKIVGFGGYIDSEVYFSKKGISAMNVSKNSLKNKKKRHKRFEKQFKKLMLKKPDLLLIHYPPYGILDKLNAPGMKLNKSHMGVAFYNTLIKKYKPKLVVCGHMHENPGKDKIGNTVIINPGAVVDGRAAIIDFDEEKGKVGKIRFIK